MNCLKTLGLTGMFFMLIVRHYFWTSKEIAITKWLKHWTKLPGFRTENGSLCPSIFAQTLYQMSRYNIFAVDPRKPLWQLCSPHRPLNYNGVKLKSWGYLVITQRALHGAQISWLPLRIGIRFGFGWEQVIIGASSSLPTALTSFPWGDLLRFSNIIWYE